MYPLIPLYWMCLWCWMLFCFRYTLSTSNSAIAALLCALYPHFPAHSTDNRWEWSVDVFLFKLFISGIFSNFTAAIKAFHLYFCRYHLQALRHLAVLAAEPRLLVPVDVDNLKPCYALLEVTYKVNWGEVAFQNSVNLNLQIFILSIKWSFLP